MIAALLLLASPAGAAAPAMTLSAFDPLVGACWRAEIAPGTTDTHCFVTMYGRAHVRDRHEVQAGGKTVYAGETVYSLDGKTVGFVYFNSLGGVGRGSVARQGTRLRFQGTIRGSPAARLQPIDSQWLLVGPDHYDTLDRGQPRRSKRFTRVK